MSHLDATQVEDQSFRWRERQGFATREPINFFFSEITEGTTRFVSLFNDIAQLRKNISRITEIDDSNCRMEFNPLLQETTMIRPSSFTLQISLFALAF